MIDTIKVCPECGKDLTGLDLIGHSLTHFPEYLDLAKSSKLARERQKQLLAGGVTKEAFDKAHKKED